MGEVGDNLLDSERTNDINQRLEVLFTRESEHKNLCTFRFRHQPQSLDISIVWQKEDTIFVTIPKLD